MNYKDIHKRKENIMSHIDAFPRAFSCRKLLFIMNSHRDFLKNSFHKECVAIPVEKCFLFLCAALKTYNSVAEKIKESKENKSNKIKLKIPSIRKYNLFTVYYYYLSPSKNINRYKIA